MRRPFLLRLALLGCATMLASPGLASTPGTSPNPGDPDAQRALHAAERYASRFYQLSGSDAGRGFRYAIRDAGNTYVVRVTPPAPQRRMLRLIVARASVRIVGAESFLSS